MRPAARAFAAYYQALFEPDSTRRTQLLFFANIAIGFHEQTRLQPEIVAALEAAVLEPAAFRRELLKALLPWRGWLRVASSAWAGICRPAFRCGSNPADFVKAVTGMALNAAHERLRVEGLLLLSGVAWPMASVILHWCHPEKGHAARRVRYG